jgi:HPt (histidine-containing phosphotransfer) domain-containing protein
VTSFPNRHIAPEILLKAVNQDMRSFQQLLEKFLQIGPPMLTRLEQAAIAADHAQVALELHSLKGTAALIGAPQLTACLEKLEAAAKRGNRIADTDLFTQMKQEFLAVTAEAQLTIDCCQANGVRM